MASRYINATVFRGCSSMSAAETEPGVFEQTEWEAEGEGVFTLVYSAGDNDDEFLLARPEDVQSLTRWR
jgi:hypothetical protein